MPSFGIIEALEKVTTPLTLELRALLAGITEEQKRTNNLLGQLVAAQREQHGELANLVVTAAEATAGKYATKPAAKK
jgi:hypothetical protein